MASLCPRVFFLLLCAALLLGRGPFSKASAQDSSSAASHAHTPQKAHPAAPTLDPGSVIAATYRNPFFNFTCKIPAAWVLRTEEMNAHDDEGSVQSKDFSQARVLLAAFSRPPQTRAEDINSSIVIAAESASQYPGLKEPAQYFGPVVEAAKAQGLEIDDDPYEFAVATKKLVRGDFQKDVGARVLHQSTLVMLARGYVVSFTFIDGTEEEVEGLVQGLSFSAGAISAK